MPDAAEPRPPRNRLSIAHLLLWTFCCAAILGGYRLVFERQFAGQQADGPVDVQTPHEFMTGMLVYYAFYSLPLGAQAAGALLWAYRTITRRGGLPTQPGHWLLIADGFAAACSLAGQLLVFSLLAAAGEGSESLWVLWAAALYLPGSIAASVFYGFALHSMEYEGKLWRAALVCLLIQRALPAIVLISLLITAEAALTGANWDLLLVNSPSCCSCLELPVMILVAVAAFGDPQRNSRDFLHWTGVNALIALQLIQLFGLFAMPFPF